VSPSAPKSDKNSGPDVQLSLRSSGESDRSVTFIRKGDNIDIWRLRQWTGGEVMAYLYRREPLDGEHCDRLVNACQSFEEKLVVWTFVDTGLRVGELVGLKREDIQWQEERVVVHGKGGPFGQRSKIRVVPLTPRVKRLLELHFVSNEGMGMSRRTAQRTVKKVANRAQITKPVTPHVLRHTFAVNCVRKGVSTASLKRLLGHEHLSTTEIYLNLSPEQAISEFRQKML